MEFLGGLFVYLHNLDLEKKSGFGGRAHDFGRVFIYAFRPLSISNPELVVT